MPTGAFTPPPSARSFALRVAAWSLGLFGLLRLPGVQASALLPVTQLQGSLAARVFGTPSVPIEVTLACSGADAIAMCAGFILGYPATWLARIRAAAGGIAVILVLNTLRIGTLGRATSPAVFEALHIYLWPVVLILAIAGYVLAWMRRVDLPAAQIHPIPRTRIVGALPRMFAVTPTFVLLTGALLVLFTAAAPLYLENRGVTAYRYPDGPLRRGGARCRRYGSDCFGQRALHRTQWFRGHAGVHLDTIDPDLPRRRDRVRGKLGPACRPAPRGRSALHSAWRRTSPGGCAAGHARRFSAGPCACVLPVAAGCRDRLLRGALEVRPRSDSDASRRGRRIAGRRLPDGPVAPRLVGRCKCLPVSPIDRRSPGRHCAPSCIPAGVIRGTLCWTVRLAAVAHMRNRPRRYSRC